MSPSNPPTLMEMVELLKHMLVARATGESTATDAEYAELRRQLLADISIATLLPTFIKTCRTLGEFWGYIKPKFGSYQQRRDFLRDQFDPVFTLLESGRCPADQELIEGIKKAGSDHVNAAWQKALARRLEDPEGAITAARTLLETVCKHLLDEMGEAYDDKADLPKLYGLTANKLNLAPSQHTEQIFKQILGGCHSVVDGLGALRNRLSDAHGKGRAAAKPQPRHAQLAVNLAGSMAMFLIETYSSRSVAAVITAGSP